MEKTSIQLEPYEEPTIEDVPLNPEETMLLGCKGNGGSGFNTGTTCKTALHGTTPCRNS